jgi:cysteine synthase
MLASFNAGNVIMPVLADPAVEDREIRALAIAHVRALGVMLPSFSQLASPALMKAALPGELAEAGPDEPHPFNLWRMSWYNAEDRKSSVDAPGFIILPEAVTGVKAPILVMFGSRFPMIGAHKVLPAYSALMSYLVTGRFDPSRQRAIWPSTGNYCRGGVAVSRTLGLRGVAVLPAGMSLERFVWLEKWVAHPGDIIRTPGTESNVKEIYDKCAELERDPQNVIFNQFSSFSNYLIHYACTGAAAEQIFLAFKGSSNRRLAAFVAATGSAGTLAAGDYLKKRYGTQIAAVEAIECPTMLNNGYGEHNIQGIGDKHIPLIHNVMNTDVVVGVSDRVTDRLNLLFGSNAGRQYLLTRRKWDSGLVTALAGIGISGLANIVASIKLAKQLHLGADDVIVTVATDGAPLYESEREAFRVQHFGERFDEVNAGEIFGACLFGIATDHVLELTSEIRRRIFNLGYYTWVEQQGVSIEEFESRRHQRFWDDIAESLPEWDRLIEEFNSEAFGARYKAGMASMART